MCLRGRRGAGEAGVQPGRRVLLRVPPPQSWELHGVHHLGGAAHPEEVRRGAHHVFPVCFKEFLLLHHRVASSDLSDWICKGMRTCSDEHLFGSGNSFHSLGCFS